MSTTRPSSSSDESQPFWDGVAAGDLVMPVDTATGSWVWPPAGTIKWKQASPAGSVVTFSIVHRAPSASNKDPYVVAFVQLDDGPRLFTRITGCPADQVSIGLRVAVTFDSVDPDGPLLPVFSPIQQEGSAQ